MSVWVGTNDTPTSGYWSPSNPAGMVMVGAYVYDKGGVGDGTLTAEIDYPGSGAAARETDYFYDWRDRIVAIKAGVQSSEDDGVNRPITFLVYNNLGEVIQTDLYAGDGVTITSTDGVPNAPSADLLRARTTADYDAQGRIYRTNTFSASPTTGDVSSDALTTNLWFDHRGYLVKTAAPGGLVTKSLYGGGGRQVAAYTTDGGGDTSWADALNVTGDIVLEEVDSQYDGDGNAIEVATRERFHDATGTGALGDPSSGFAARVYYVGMYYDALSRLTATVDVGTNGGSAWTRPTDVPDRSDTVLVTSTTFNAAGWAEDVTDPRGIVDHTGYDNLGRTVETIAAYTDGVPTEDTNNTTLYGYTNGNLTSLTVALPGGGEQQTQYVYGTTVAGGSAVDSNDVLAATWHPDPTTGAASSAQAETMTYNALGQVLTATDRNGTTHTYSYDVLGRVVSDAVTTLGVGVDGAVRRIDYAYDSQGNAYLITSYDAVSGGGIVNQVMREYNGLGQMTAEYQAVGGAVDTATTPVVQYAYREMAGGANDSRLLSMTYPNGRVLSYNYASGLDDSIGRLSSISDSSGTLEAYTYLGLDTVVERAQPQAGTELTYIKQAGEPNGDAGDQYTGLDRFGRVVDQRWLNSSGAATNQYLYGYDRDSNPLYKQDVVNAAFSELYHANGATNGYDPLNQLTGFSRGVLSDTNSDGVPDTVASASNSQSWTLDAQGNPTSVTTNGTTQDSTANAQNQLTAVGTATLTYDANGNMTTNETGQQMVYDAWNRLVEVKDSSGTPVATYSYDGLGRRVTEVHGSAQSNLYYSAQWQVLEERDGSGNVQMQYVWSPVYVDALVLRDRSTGSDGILNERLYVQQDANWNVTALVNTTGTVVERYVYNPYGQVTVLAADYTTLSGSAYAWQYLHQGGRLDSATGLYDFRNRDYSPTLGRWIENDPLGFNADDTNTYRTEGNNPISSVDPSGELANTVVGGIIGAVGGAFYGGATGRCSTWYNPLTWNPQRMLAGALSGAMIGVGLGLAADTWGVATPFTFGLISGAIGAGFGSAACGGVLSGDCQINWAGFIQGAGIGAVAGFIGGYVGGAATAWTGASWLGGVAAAGIGGWYADVTWQAGGIASGLQETPYSFTQTVEVALTSASGAGVLQWAAQAMYRPAQIIPSTPTPSQFILGVSAEEAALLRAGVQQISGHVHSSVCGSRTPGAARPPSLQSDVDIIVVRQGGVPPATEATAIENALSQLVGPRVHLNFMTPEVYETLWRGAVNEYPIE